MRGLIPFLSLALVAACSGSEPAGPTSTAAGGITTTVPLEGPPSGIIEEFDHSANPVLDPLAAAREAGGGLLSTQDALDLFAAVYGDVPGADGSRFDPSPHDASMAVRNVFRVFDALTPEQQDAVLVRYASESPQALGDGVAYLVSYERAALTAGGDITALATAAEAEIAGLLGRPLGLELDVITGFTFEDDDIGGDAAPVGGGVPFREPYDTCQVRFVADLGSATANTVAHEVFHCFQYALSTAATSAPDWIAEGQAEWVGARVGGSDYGTAEIWTEWVTGTYGSLFNKDYSAAGFFWVIEQAGINPWAVMPAKYCESNEAAVAATGLSGAEAMRWVGTTTARADVRPTVPLSNGWRIGAGDAPDRGVRARVNVSEDSPFERSRAMDPFSAAPSQDFRLDGDVVTITAAADAGAFEFVDKEFNDFNGSYVGRFCIREGGCSCGSEGEEDLGEGSDRLFLSLASVGGGLASVSVQVEEYGEGFADGTWTGELMSTIIYADISGALVSGEPLGAPFEFTVTDGRVEGTYGVAMHEEVRFEDNFAQGTGTIAGIVTGCWFAPQLVATSFSFEGTMTMEGNTVPFNFSIPFEAAEGSAAPVWTFDESTDAHQASGMLETEPYLQFMRSVGVNVNDVQISFTATNTGG
jgi:hypothetical protein